MMHEKLLVCQGAECKCTLGSTPGVLAVTSQNSKKLEGKLQATAGDKTFSTPFDACTRNSSNPPCTPQLQNWQGTTQNTKIQGHQALLEDSTNTCTHGGQISITDPGQSTGKIADFPSLQIKRKMHAEIHFRRKLATISSRGTVGYQQDYAIFPHGLSDIIKAQVYGFDWVRDVLDGQEGYLHKISPRSVYISGTGNQYGKHAHWVDVDMSTRKILGEKFYVVAGEIIRNRRSMPYNGDIIEYDSSRAKTATHAYNSSSYNSIMATIGGSYTSLHSTVITTSFNPLAQLHSPVTYYIDTPFGTENIGGNAANLTIEINEKNYYVPWLAVRQSETAEIQALCFADKALPAGEIRFVPSDTAVQVTPQKVSGSSIAVHPYPTTTQTSDTVPASNKISLEISFTSVLNKDAVLEARFFDTGRANDASYKGELLGVMNISKNDPEYEMQPRFVKVYFTDENNVMGNVLPLKLNSSKLASPTVHTANSQLIEAQRLMELFKKLMGDQHYYLEKLFGQALIEYKSPIYLSDGDNNWNQVSGGKPVLDSNKKRVPNAGGVGVDISEFVPAGQVPALTGNNFSGIYN